MPEINKSDQAGAAGLVHPALAGDHRSATRQRGNIADPESGHRHGNPNRSADADHDRSHRHVRAGNHAGASGRGIALAKAKGVYKGRKPTAMEKRDEVLHLLSQGVAKTAVAKKLGISVSSVHRIVA